MFSLDNEMYMSTVDVSQINKFNNRIDTLVLLQL